LLLTKLISVSWVTAHRMLRKLRVAMGDQNRLYRLEGIIELDDAFVGGKTVILVVCEHNNGKPGFIGMIVVDRVDQGSFNASLKKPSHPNKLYIRIPSSHSGYLSKGTTMSPKCPRLN